MNQDQILSLVRTLLAAGGPIAGILTNAGMQPGAVNNVISLALAVSGPLVSLIWGWVTHTDGNSLVTASNIAGATVTVDPLAASAAVAKVANDPTNNVKVAP